MGDIRSQSSEKRKLECQELSSDPQKQKSPRFVPTTTLGARISDYTLAGRMNQPDFQKQVFSTQDHNRKDTGETSQETQTNTNKALERDKNSLSQNLEFGRTQNTLQYKTDIFKQSKLIEQKKELDGKSPVIVQGPDGKLYKLHWKKSAQDIADELNANFKNSYYHLTGGQVKALRNGKSLHTKNGWNVPNPSIDQLKRNNKTNQDNINYQKGRKEYRKKYYKDHSNHIKEKASENYKSNTDIISTKKKYKRRILKLRSLLKEREECITILSKINLETSSGMSQTQKLNNHIKRLDQAIVNTKGDIDTFRRKLQGIKDRRKRPQPSVYTLEIPQQILESTVRADSGLALTSELASETNEERQSTIHTWQDFQDFMTTDEILTEQMRELEEELGQLARMEKEESNQLSIATKEDDPQSQVEITIWEYENIDELVTQYLNLYFSEEPTESEEK